MAQIDLRNTVIEVYDGYSGPGGAGARVNLMGGYMSGATTMAVDGITGALAVGDTFLVAGDTLKHTISAHTEAGGNTTSITFAPALGATVADDAVITILPHSIRVNLSDGTLTYDESRQFKYILDRGTLNTIRQEDDVPVDVKIDALWDFLTGDTSDPPTIEDAMKKRGTASAWVTSSADTCEPYAVNLRVVYTPPCGGVKTETIALKDFRWEKFNHDLKQGMLSVSGKCNITQATVTRA